MRMTETERIINMALLQFYVDDLIKNAIMEDINYVDVTSDYLLSDDMKAEAYFIAKDSGVLCGIDVAMRVFELLDSSIEYDIKLTDGTAVQNGDIIAEMRGPVKSLLKGERTALNLLQHMSGIATAANKYCKLVEGTKASIADTRKTLPGLRAIQKYAVTVGGGRNHRYNLSDCAMLKDNHIDAYGSMTNAVKALREKVGHTIKIEVETRNLDELHEALECGADVIMLDNMSNEMMAKAVEITNSRALLEASGNVNEERIKSIADTGVDIISIGALTHSVKCFDISMRIKNTADR